MENHKCIEAIEFLGLPDENEAEFLEFIQRESCFIQTS